ncbi:hypothetical protein HYALB_00008472 [Hymenoscyphus albidus]|uniref:Uncharacterized protein n=1 Tax=Hymenoscyphus albidus TaxID=595503 RepID=A0A9N9LK87_9HELO|nr:hypothetical protein HYALB_00008472 [Hymenoscyphus albidus]
MACRAIDGNKSEDD